MDEHVYAVPDLTTDIKYGPRDRGEREERVVDIYVSADHLGPDPDPDPDPDPGSDPDPGTQQNTAQALHGASDESKKKNAFKAATVCLGVLCVILLAGITGLGVRNSKLINNLTKELDIITAERDELKRMRLCESPGWQRFGCSSYFISTEEKTWNKSRQWCRDNQADLIIINSKEEQDFVNRVVNSGQYVWLGLTDREEEGVWKWIDGKPLTSPTYWYTATGQPDNAGGVQDCAVRLSGSGGWFDRRCTYSYRWMCEKVV